MIYTKEQLEKMSDHEINLAVAEKQFGKIQVKVIDEAVKLKSPAGFWHEFNSCLDWNDAMDISIKNWIQFDTHGNGINEYSSWSFGSKYSSSNENPKRSICEVFLMMDIG